MRISALHLLDRLARRALKCFANGVDEDVAEEPTSEVKKRRADRGSGVDVPRWLGMAMSDGRARTHVGLSSAPRSELRHRWRG